MATAKYDPDPAAQPTDLWATVYLSSRDLVAQVPINFAAHPGVVLTAACFGNGTYSTSAAAKCISNLLAAQYRRLILDLYWDPTARKWSFCPVALPASITSSTTTQPLNTPTSFFAQISTVALSRPSTTTRGAVRRQATDTLSSSPFPGNSSVAAPVTSASIPIATVTGSTAELLYQLGPYQCSQHLDSQTFIALFLQYLQQTGDTIQARLLWLDLNLHAAASPDAPGGPPGTLTGSQLPSYSELIGQQLNNSVQSYLYRPTELESDRSNLNASWFDVPASQLPIPAYFGTTSQPNGLFSSVDGWPNEIFTQMNKVKRMLLGWGTVDPQMQGYNFSGDSATVFSMGYMLGPRTITSDSLGELQSGCLFDAQTTNISQVNSSWVFASMDQVQSEAGEFLSTVNNMTSCGLSPVLNATLGNQPANLNPAPYTNFAHSSIWSWAPGEPRNVTQPGFDDDNPPSRFRCALMDTTAAYVGHWRVEDCSNQYRAACRVDGEPYAWKLSDEHVQFKNAPFSCPAGTSFSAPRTGLENRYLYYDWNISANQGDSSSEGTSGVWVNFNSLDVQACWVTTGPNGTCPYYVDEQAAHSRAVLVPTIAAIIVLVLTCLTLFAKCSVNRKNSRRTRRGDGNWDYEGVPS